MMAPYRIPGLFRVDQICRNDPKGIPVKHNLSLEEAQEYKAKRDKRIKRAYDLQGFKAFSYVIRKNT